ncbi:MULTISPECIES: hypothetical protein [unclassified Acinetobacter]|uniref:hypothetical protein n=1 Tax=unclassified Acinetobacter TaxID=196816 RepID=UPI00190DB691|nr:MULTISPECIES: hypothetical protein [unclassified Acinetobacter]MBK0064973.1 hypothetical protein [Acinetobacter sp. S55]MBK0067336.1 hypothetical protein [Acinetobacter sp. S54]
MQDSAFARWLSPFMAFCFTFIIIAALASAVGIQIDRQIDFWLLWLATMVILALPVCYLEIALAKRSKTTALNALSSLTRDADASQKWRIVGWLAVAFIPFLAGAILSHLGAAASATLGLNLSVQAMFAGLTIVALALSFVPRQILLILMMIGVVISFISSLILVQPAVSWHWTSIEFKEWGNATVLALVATGLGMGLYWQNSLQQVQDGQQASKTALPIWIAQFIAVIAFGFYSALHNIPVLTLAIAGVMAAALLLQLAKEQLQQRQLSVVIQWAVLFVATFIWLIPQVQFEFNILLMLWGLLICLIYSIFAGWIMKISHLRKSMNFSNELFYNLWRIAVRIVLPLSIVLAMIAIIGQLFS